MSTRAFASSIINVDIEQVWKVLREFTFPAKVISTIDSVVMENNDAPTTVGAVRTLKWKTGEIRKSRLLEVSDLRYTVSWELIESVPETEVTASISTIKLTRISESNHTLVSWEGEFSSDVKNDVIQFEQKSYQLNLQEIKKFFSK
eukprot:gene1226-1549_t